MRTLEEAWTWYVSTRRNLRGFERLAKKYWNALPWEETNLSRDPHFVDFKQEQVIDEVGASVRELDELAILVLFSVFESIVRTRMLDEVRPELESLTHRSLRSFAKQVSAGLGEGSFHNNVLAPLKGSGADDLIEHVNQVRRYRNWVAHGRNPNNKPADVSAADAYERLQAFLDYFRSENIPS